MRTNIRPTDGVPRKLKPPPNYFSRREQYRLLILVSMFMLVLALMNEARKPSTWAWLWNLDGSRAEEPAPPVDTRVQPEPARQLPPDGFRAVGNPAPATRDLAAPTHDRSGYPPGISVEMLSAITDNTVLQASENKAWLAMFALLQTWSEQEIEAATFARVGFLQLFRQTEIYRGKIVAFAGIVHRLEEITPRENNIGMSQLYRWIVEPSGNGSSPVVIYTLEKPNGLAPADDMREYCEFRGFCFKRWAYAAGDGPRIAPLLLAKNAAWEPAAAIPEPLFAPSGGILAALCVLLGGIATAIAMFVYRTTITQRADIQRLRTGSANVEDAVRHEAVLPGVHESLQQLAERTEPTSGTQE